MLHDHEYHSLTVADAIRETADTRSLVLDIPPHLEETFAYDAGQFCTFRATIDGESVVRCYSMSSSPDTRDPFSTAVKRVPGGLMSNWMNDALAPGDTIDVLRPTGLFVLRDNDAPIVAFAGGSGITPVISILKSALAAGRGRVMLIYANRDERSVIFSSELRRLAAEAAGRLLVVHWLDSLHGEPTVAGMAALARPYTGAEAFACGPDPYLAVVRRALSQLGVKAVHLERFLSLAENPFEVTEAAGGVAAALQVSLDGATREVPWPAGTRMLDVLIDEGLDPPYSCRQGICGACACQLTGGEVEMAHNEVLEAEDLAEGYILACQAVALTPEVSITYP